MATDVHERSHLEASFRAPDDTDRQELPQYLPGDMQLGGAPVLRNYFGSLIECPPGPQAYLTEVFPENSRVGAHFHSTDQFQLFRPSVGTWYQRHGVDSTTLHYADAYTTYGPFGTGDHPMSYFTMRAEASDMIGWMPGARDQMRKPSGRNILVELSPFLSREVEYGDSIVEAMIQPTEDGLAAYLCAVGAGATVATPASPAHCAGQYLCVLSGALQYKGKTFGPHSLAWSPPGANSATLSAGPADGFELLVCQFPVSTTAGLDDGS